MLLVLFYPDTNMMSVRPQVMHICSLHILCIYAVWTLFHVHIKWPKYYSFFFLSLVFTSLACWLRSDPHMWSSEMILVIYINFIALPSSAYFSSSCSSTQYFLLLGDFCFQSSCRKLGVLLPTATCFHKFTLYGARI